MTGGGLKNCCKKKEKFTPQQKEDSNRTHCYKCCHALVFFPSGVVKTHQRLETRGEFGQFGSCEKLKPPVFHPVFL